MSNIDPYNNAPAGSKCGKGSCSKPSSNLQNQKTSESAPDLYTINSMLRSDLNVAIQYITQLGGTWPPPGH